ncbi:MAG: iron-containing alcohol dehydrogenase [Lachnobacterium sp.]|nr:iron-containing alcohol dehydrogenase [Lachnobacterium sp.]
MKKIVLGKDGIITGSGALEYLTSISYKRVFIVTGGNSMIKTGVIDKAQTYLKQAGCEVTLYSGIKKNPTIEQVMDGLNQMRSIKPDAILAIGGGSAMDAAKAMLLFYDFPELNFENVLEKNTKGQIPSKCKTALICVASTSGTGSEVTRGTVITDTKNKIKVPIMTDCLRPDIAILDGSIAMTMPQKIAAETGMDALTHAIEAYINHNLDDFDEVICKGAIEGIMANLEKSCKEPTVEIRQKVHNYQAMAGIGFANVGLGMVHGIAHSYGAIFDMAHGLTNAIILPYVLEYNRRNDVVKEKLKYLSYHCRCTDIVKEIWKLREKLEIPNCFAEAGISQKEFEDYYELLVDHAMLGTTKVNPVEMTRKEMEKMVKMVYYGKE